MLQGKVLKDFAYMQCYVDGRPMDLRDILGKENISYSIVLPSGTNLYTAVRLMKHEVIHDHIQYATLQEQNM